MGTELTAGPPVAANLRKRVAEIAWFHRIDLGGGGVTPGRDPGPARLRRLALPDLSGKTVLAPRSILTMRWSATFIDFAMPQAASSSQRWRWS